MFSPKKRRFEDIDEGSQHEDWSTTVLKKDGRRFRDVPSGEGHFRFNHDVNDHTKYLAHRTKKLRSESTQSHASSAGDLPNKPLSDRQLSSHPFEPDNKAAGASSVFRCSSDSAEHNEASVLIDASQSKPLEINQTTLENYRILLNEHITDAARPGVQYVHHKETRQARSSAQKAPVVTGHDSASDDDNNYDGFQMTQIGGVDWGPQDKECFFHAIARFGLDFDRLAAAVGKSPLQVAHYAVLLKRCNQKYLTEVDEVNAAIVPAAVDVKSDCAQTLERLGDGVAKMCFQRECAAEVRRYGRHWLIQSEHVEQSQDFANSGSIALRTKDKGKSPRCAPCASAMRTCVRVLGQGKCQSCAKRGSRCREMTFEEWKRLRTRCDQCWKAPFKCDWKPGIEACTPCQKAGRSCCTKHRKTEEPLDDYQIDQKGDVIDNRGTPMATTGPGAHQAGGFSVTILPAGVPDSTLDGNNILDDSAVSDHPSESSYDDVWDRTYKPSDSPSSSSDDSDAEILDHKVIFEAPVSNSDNDGLPLLDHHALLALSTDIFMSSTSPDMDWRTHLDDLPIPTEQSSNLLEEPAMFCSAYDTLTSLTVAFVRRLLDATVNQARFRTRCEDPGDVPVVSAEDVRAACAILNVPESPFNFWADLPTRRRDLRWQPLKAEHDSSRLSRKTVRNLLALPIAQEREDSFWAIVDEFVAHVKHVQAQLGVPESVEDGLDYNTSDDEDESDDEEEEEQEEEDRYFGDSDEDQGHPTDGKATQYEYTSDEDYVSSEDEDNEHGRERNEQRMDADLDAMDDLEAEKHVVELWESLRVEREQTAAMMANDKQIAGEDLDLDQDHSDKDWSDGDFSDDEVSD